ncbi:MAG: hypothetical protein IJP75_02125 [Bacteroidaceae bacterium]|nr:hypothetical protein [Bacteroidaceae bacterium]
METMNGQTTPNAAPTLADLPEDIRKQAEEAFWTGHYPYLMQALTVAMSRCQVWRLVNSDEVFTLVEVFNFAKDWDEQHPPKEGEFYLVSVEGAIGLCCHVEYTVKWLFTPMEPGAERDALLQDMQQQLEKMAAEEEGVQAAASVPPAESATPPPFPGVPPTMTPPPFPPPFQG